MLDEALTLAVARQESEMNPTAISGAGARGFMQIMPGTAKQVATKLNIDYDNQTSGSANAKNQIADNVKREK